MHQLNCKLLLPLLKIVVSSVDGQENHTHPLRLLKACRPLSILFFSQTLFVYHKASDQDQAIPHSDKGIIMLRGNVGGGCRFDLSTSTPYTLYHDSRPP